MNSTEDNNIIPGSDTSNNIIPEELTNERRISYNDGLLDYLSFLQENVNIQRSSWNLTDISNIQRSNWNLTDISNIHRPNWNIMDLSSIPRPNMNTMNMLHNENAILVPQGVQNLLNTLQINSGRNRNQLNDIIRQSMTENSQYKKVLSESGESELTKIIYESGKFPNERCSIMHIDFEDGEEVTQLPCTHCFNTDAIHRWLKEEKAECPICRTELNSKEVKVTNNDEAAEELEPSAIAESQIRNSRQALLSSLSRLPHAPSFGRGVFPPIISGVRPGQYETEYNSLMNRHITATENDEDLEAAIMASLIDYNR